MRVEHIIWTEAGCDIAGLLLKIDVKSIPTEVIVYLDPEFNQSLCIHEFDREMDLIQKIETVEIRKGFLRALEECVEAQNQLDEFVKDVSSVFLGSGGLIEADILMNRGLGSQT